MKSLAASTTYTVSFSTSSAADATPTATAYADATSLGTMTVTPGSGTNDYTVAVVLPGNVTQGQIVTVKIDWDVGGTAQATATLLVGEVALNAEIASAVASNASSTPLHADVRLVNGQTATASETIDFDTINDGGTVVLPASATVPSRGTTDTIVLYEGETIAQSITITDANGDAQDMSGKTLAVEVEDRAGTDVATIVDGSITVSGASSQTLSFAWPSTVTASVRTLRYAVRDASAPRTLYASGTVEVRDTTEAD